VKFSAIGLLRKGSGKGEKSGAVASPEEKKRRKKEGALVGASTIIEEGGRQGLSSKKELKEHPLGERGRRGKGKREGTSLGRRSPEKGCLPA